MEQPEKRALGSLALIIYGMLFFVSPSFSQWSDFITVDGVGWEGQGAGIAFTNLDIDPRPEMIMMAYDNPGGGNTFRYNIGWNVNNNGVASNWTGGDIPEIPGVGNEGQGADVELINLNNDDNPEMILMAYDNPRRANTFRYRIGWDLNNAGVTTNWSNHITVQGVGSEGQGAGMAFTNLDNDRRPEMILMAYDNPRGANTFRYRIGWNINNNGIAANWSDFITASGVGWDGQGADVTITNLDNDQRPEMVLMAYDNPAGDNTFRYVIGWNMNSDGTASNWSEVPEVPGVGFEGQGTGFAVFNLDNNPLPEFIVMAYDNPEGANTFRYRIGWNMGRARNIHLEEDRLTGLAWPPNNVNRGGRINSLQTIYTNAGYDLTELHDQTINDPLQGNAYADADLDAFFNNNINQPPANPNTWHIYCAVLTRHVSGWLGIMFRRADRRGFAVFTGAIGTNDEYLGTSAHELGHALNLFHSDGDANLSGAPQAGQGHTIMNQTWSLANDWDFVWSAAELDHHYEHPEEFIRPNSDFGFGTCITTHRGLY